MPSKALRKRPAAEPRIDVAIDRHAPPVDEEAALDAMAELLLDLVERDQEAKKTARRDPGDRGGR